MVLWAKYFFPAVAIVLCERTGSTWMYLASVWHEVTQTKFNVTVKQEQNYLSVEYMNSNFPLLFGVRWHGGAANERLLPCQDGRWGSGQTRLLAPSSAAWACLVQAYPDQLGLLWAIPSSTRFFKSWLARALLLRLNDCMVALHLCTKETVFMARQANTTTAR